MLELKITSYNKLKIAITMKNLSGQSRKPKKGLQKDGIAKGQQTDSKRMSEGQQKDMIIDDLFFAILLQSFERKIFFNFCDNFIEIV